MTGVVFHKTMRTSWRQRCHSYLIDVGTGIEIQQIEVTDDLFENRTLVPPFPVTRYFEVEIDESRRNGKKIAVFKSIVPVIAHRKPDWHILKFRIRRGGWTITERLQKKTPMGEVQWIYTDDFNILFLSSGGRHDTDMLVSLITGKLNTITRSILDGSRIPSEFENQLSCRNAFDTMFADGVDGAFRDAVLYREHASAISGELGKNGPQAARSEICSNHGHVVVGAAEAAALNVDLTQIDELNDLSWLNE